MLNVFSTKYLKSREKNIKMLLKALEKILSEG